MPNKEASALWRALSKAQQHELVRVIKSAKAQKKSNSIIECYKHSGGLENSIANEANEILLSHASREKIGELVIKSLTGKGAVLRPIKYKTIVSLLKSRGRFEEGQVRNFINYFSDEGLGLLQIIPSSRIEEELSTIDNVAHIDDNAIVTIRNDDLLRKNAKFVDWINSERECISEYLMYAQIANTDAATYPITLQLYANTILTRAPLESCRHSTIVHEFLQKDRVWATLHTKFIARGVDYWHNIRKSEENRKKDEKRIRRIKRNINVFIFISICLFAGHTYVEVIKGILQKRLDCLYDDHLRLVRELHVKYIGHLEKGGRSDSQVYAWVDTLLAHRDKVDKAIDSLHSTSALRFAFQYAGWQAAIEDLLDDTTRRGILKSALEKNYLKSKGNEILTIDGYKLFDHSVFPKDTLYIVDCSKCEFIMINIDL
jgi:hypothetical protein